MRQLYPVALFAQFVAFCNRLHAPPGILGPNRLKVFLVESLAERSLISTRQRK